MLETLSDDTQGQGLDPGDRFSTVLAVCHHAGQSRYFRQPPAVVFTFDFDVKRHVGNVPSGQLSNMPLHQTAESRITDGRW